MHGDADACSSAIAFPRASEQLLELLVREVHACRLRLEPSQKPLGIRPTPVQSHQQTPASLRIRAGLAERTEFLFPDTRGGKDHAIRLLARRTGFQVARGDVNEHSNAGPGPEIDRLDAAGLNLNLMKFPQKQEAENAKDVVEILRNNNRKRDRHRY